MWKGGKSMIVQRVERQILKPNKRIDELCFLSKNLYNYCNYILRQSYFETRKLPKEFDLSKQLTAEKQEDWMMLGANVNQQCLKLLYKNWNSYFTAIAEYKRNPEKFLARPKIPNYKDKKDGRNIVVFPCNHKSNIKNGYFHFPKFTNLSPIKTDVTNETLCCVRIIPQTSCYVLEIIYKKEIPDNFISDKSYLSIDLGINNFATCFNDTDNSSFIINGKIIKSYNQYYNKKSAEIKSTLKTVNNKETSKKLKRLCLKRENKINDFMHKSSRFIVDYCLQNGIWNIVIGHNDFWKQDVNLGSANNQKFTQIPFNKFIQQLQYKCEEVGINFIKTEESYTSKADHFVYESMEHHDTYSGKRIHRGLFKSSADRIINADVNGAIGILRKVINESYFHRIVDRGFVINPYKINIYQ